MKLRAEHLIKKYKSRTVVKDVSLDVEQGEIVGLLGPNGAGKTTSFYMIVGLITPNGGRIFLDDLEITKEPVYRRAQLGVGYLAQEASVFRRLSVEDNIRAVLEMTKMTKEEQKTRLEEMLDEFGLQHIRKVSSFPEASAGARKLPVPSPSAPSSSFWTNLLQASTPSPWRTSSPSSGSSRIKISAS